MRSRPSLPAALVAAVTALLVLLAGCSSEAASSGAASLADVTVAETGEAKAPVITVPRGLSVPSTGSRVIVDGQGVAVAEGDVIGMQYVMINGRTGERLAASAWGEAPTSLVVDGSILPGLKSGLVGRAEGTEVLIAVAPQEGLGNATPPVDDKVEPGDTVLFFVRIVSVVPPRAVGTPEKAEAGLPTVELDPATGRPTITIPEGEDPPEEGFVVQRLIRGTGPEVAKGDTIRVHYTGVKWSDREEFDSSWGTAGEDPGAPVPFVIGEGQVIQAWDTALVGQPVGSQVLIIVPPKEGYGEEGNEEAGISGTETLVFVVDILATS